MPYVPYSKHFKATRKPTSTLHKRKVTKPNPKTRKNYKISKVRRTNRLVGPSFAKPLYNKKKSFMRRFNSGKLSLQNRLQNGLTLPQTTYARLYWRGSGAETVLVRNPVFSGSQGVNLNGRTLCLNDVSTPPSLGSQFNHPVTYSGMWQQLYNEYLVLGTKLKIKITPSQTPDSNIFNAPNTPFNNRFSMNLPLSGVKAGFWYVRCFYYRDSDGADLSKTMVGHKIEPGNYSNPNSPFPNIPSSDIDDKSENYWNNMRDFMTDKTVTWKKDNSIIRQKLHIVTNKPVNPTIVTDPPGTSTTQPLWADTENTTTYEIEQNTKPVHLSVNFSAKKHFEDKNPIRNQPFMTWNESLSDKRRFYVRVGYIAFGADETVSFHIPLSRNPNIILDYDIKYFVAFRQPNIAPDVVPESHVPEGRRLPPEIDIADINENLLEDDFDEYLDDELIDDEPVNDEV